MSDASTEAEAAHILEPFVTSRFRRAELAAGIAEGLRDQGYLRGGSSLPVSQGDQR